MVGSCVCVGVYGDVFSSVFVRFSVCVVRVCVLNARGMFNCENFFPENLIKP